MKPEEMNEIQKFVETIAGMTKTGEIVDGQEFVIKGDDAIYTLNGLISQARNLTTVTDDHLNKTDAYAMVRTLCYLVILMLFGYIFGYNLALDSAS